MVEVVELRERDKYPVQDWWDFHLMAHPVRDWSCMHAGNHSQLRLPFRQLHHEGKYYNRDNYKNAR